MIERMGFGELRLPNPIFSALLTFRALGESERMFDNQDFNNKLIEIKIASKGIESLSRLSGQLRLPS